MTSLKIRIELNSVETNKWDLMKSGLQLFINSWTTFLNSAFLSQPGNTENQQIPLSR